jgi:hypothetical protein
VKAPFCKLCETEHWSSQPHGGALTPKKLDIRKIESKAATAGKKKAKRK